MEWFEPETILPSKTASITFQILKPVKTAIILLKSASANLADCFLQLILLANAIKNLPIQGMQEL
ncbi:6090_t:CDS:2 [Funneliformis geosporum]|nr:6090_t:CDS:2 [Funneliformis geosporum]